MWTSPNGRQNQRPRSVNNTIHSNFDMLRAYEAQLWRLGALAERYFAEDPNTGSLSDLKPDIFSLGAI